MECLTPGLNVCKNSPFNKELGPVMSLIAM